MYHSQQLEEKVATSQNQDQDEFVNLSPLFQHGSLTTGMNSLPRPLHSCSDVLTDAGWITSCPRPITDVLAGTHVVYTQCVATVTSVGGSCSYDGWSSWWLVAHHAIATASYTCNNGYTLSVNNMRTCQADNRFVLYCHSVCGYLSVAFLGFHSQASSWPTAASQGSG